MVIPFEVSAADLNLADTAGYTLYSFSSSNLLKVPIRLELCKDAGTAYTVTAPQYVVRKVEYFQASVDNYAEQFQGGSFLIVESRDAQGRSKPLFVTPLTGFLDSASEERRLVFPCCVGDTYRAGATSIVLRTTVNVASGTGSLKGRLYIDELPIGGF